MAIVIFSRFLQALRARLGELDGNFPLAGIHAVAPAPWILAASTCTAIQKTRACSAASSSDSPIRKKLAFIGSRT